MKNILVTGGAGFIGSHTVVELVAAGYRPVIVDNYSNSNASVIGRLEQISDTHITIYEQDYRDIVRLKQIIIDENISGIIHFAASKAVGESLEIPLHYYDNNVAGFIALLQLCESKDTPVAHVVFSSSCTVYGNPDSLPVTESSPIKSATSPYGYSKQIDETILHDTIRVSQKLNAIALRYFNPVGAHPSALIGELPIGTPANLIPFLTQTAAGMRSELTVYGNDYDTPDGSCIRDYVHVVDLANAHVAALAWLEQHALGAYETCNIGSGIGSSVLEAIETFERVTGEKVPYRIGDRRDGDVVATYADVTKANSLLRWSTKKTLADALADAWRWQQTLR